MVYGPPAILVVDDDEAIFSLICEGLAELEYHCDFASSSDDAVTMLRRRSFDLVLLDIRLPGRSGMDLLKSFETSFQTTSVIMITGVKDVETAVRAMQLGASDYIVKPFTIDKLNASIASALRNRTISGSVGATTQIKENNSQAKSIGNQSRSTMNAIAFGVDAQVDYFDFHSKIVTERTVGLARWLGLPAKEIEDWVTTQNTLCSEKLLYLRSISSKVEQNPIAQMILGLTQPVCEVPESKTGQN